MYELQFRPTKRYGIIMTHFIDPSVENRLLKDQDAKSLLAYWEYSYDLERDWQIQQTNKLLQESKWLDEQIKEEMLPLATKVAKRLIGDMMKGGKDKLQIREELQSLKTSLKSFGWWEAVSREYQKIGKVIDTEFDLPIA